MLFPRPRYLNKDMLNTPFSGLCCKKSYCHLSELSGIIYKIMSIKQHPPNKVKIYRIVCVKFYFLIGVPYFAMKFFTYICGTK